MSSKHRLMIDGYTDWRAGEAASDFLATHKTREKDTYVAWVQI